ncbi:AAA family ATPase (plasmid) [Prescottella equi]|uniref:MinD/ParA family ATP-binding protein n=1 Tax=Rhodococcus hoagii TaxID=43767 RepID=UPI0025790D4C|nr:AAA family ATPase [Prescottella equi]WJJ14697.1 AAA family ATPase [Prescottella equi]
MADISDYDNEAPVDVHRQRLRPTRPQPAPEPLPEPEEIPDPYGVGTEALTAVDDPGLPETPTAPTASLFDERALASATSVTPARWGWRGRVNAALGLKLAPQPDSAEVRFRDSVGAIQRTLPGTATIAVVNTKGGSGKTPTTVTLSAILGEHRGQGVVALDASESGGTLGSRAAKTSDPERTVWDVLTNASKLVSVDAAAGDLASYLRRQPTRDEILAGDTDSSHDEMLGWDECAALAAVLRRHRDLLIVDTATNPQAPAWLWAVHHADLLVVPLPLRRDMAQHAHAMLDALNKRGLQHLVRTAVVLLCETPGANLALEDIVVSEFETLGVESFVRVPYEPAFASGERLGLDALGQSSIEAWTNVAALVVEGLTTSIAQRQSGQRTLPPLTHAVPAAVDPEPVEVPEPEPERQPEPEGQPETAEAPRRPQPPKPKPVNPYA